MMITEPRINEEQAWQQLLVRDPKAEFFYAVSTTGVFCRPTCSSRRPLRENVRFFASAEEAESNGFRACQRCKPELPEPAPAVERMCAYLEKRLDRPVRLAELGRLTGISPFTAQRLFKAAMGASPAEYQRALRAKSFREQLKGADTTVTTAIYEAGYGSSSRAYENTSLGMTPSRFLAGGRGETIRFAVASVPLGWIILGATDRGICWLALADSEVKAEASLRGEFPAAVIKADPSLENYLAEVAKQVHGEQTSHQLPLDLRGTAFQLRVWKALQQIAFGETRTYSQLAADMGHPTATRAVARACALNRVSVLVPCHRVIGVSGSLTGYRWGVDRKRQLLAAESGR